MSSIEVCIVAEGSLPPEEVRELADLGLRRHVDHVVLEGRVADQAALIGVLERLRRAGLRVRDVAPREGAENEHLVASLAILGQVGVLVRTVLKDAAVREHPTVTLADVPLSRADDLFDVLSRLGSLGLELRSVHVGLADPSPGDG